MPAPSADLSGIHPCIAAPESLGPKRDQRAVRRSGHGILGNADAGREKARYEVRARSLGRYDDRKPIQTAKPRKIGLELAHQILGLEDDEIAAAREQGAI